MEVVYIIRSGSEKFALQCEHKRESRYRRRCEFVAAAPGECSASVGGTSFVLSGCCVAQFASLV